MRKLALLLVVSAVAFVSLDSASADEPRAQEIVRQARAALGGEEQLNKIQSLGIVGQYRRILGERELAGDREVSILLPDKYLVEDAINPGGLSTAMINTRGLNGEQAWNRSSGGGGGMIIRMGGPGGQQATPEQMEAMLRRQHRVEFARYLLAILVMPPPSMEVQYAYAGESEVDDLAAQVVDVTGAERFAVRVFFDQKTHLPLLLSYRGIKPRIVTAFNRTAERNAKPEDAIKRATEEAEKKVDGQPEREEVDFFIRVSDYKKVGRLSLPYRLTFLTDKEVSEEFQISKYQLNPEFKSDRFEKP